MEIVWVKVLAGFVEALVAMLVLCKLPGLKKESNKAITIIGVIVLWVGNTFSYDNLTIYAVYLLVVVMIYFRIALKGSVLLCESILAGMWILNVVFRVIVVGICAGIYEIGTLGIGIAIFLQKMLLIDFWGVLLLVVRKDRFAIENAALNERMKQQQINMLRIEEDYYCARKLRHDINKSLNIYIRLLKEGKVLEVINLMSEQIKEIPQRGVVYFSENTIINAVLNEKIHICKQKGIECGVQLSAQIDNVREMDVAVMLSNLLDNAIESQDTDCGASIKVSIFGQNGMYNVLVKNTISRSVLKENPQLMSGKADTFFHGIGIKSIKDTVEKYNGLIDFEERNGEFVAHVAIPKEVTVC